MDDDHPKGKQLRVWLIVHNILLTATVGLVFYLLHEYPSKWSIFLVQPGDKVDWMMYAVVAMVLVVCLFGTLGFYFNHHGIIHLVSKEDLTGGLAYLHYMHYKAANGGLEFSVSDLTKFVLRRVYEYMFGSKGADAKASPDDRVAQTNTTSLDYHSLDQIISACCGPKESEPGVARRICKNDDMPLKGSECTDFYMLVSGLNYLAIMALTGVFYINHGMTATKQVLRHRHKKANKAKDSTDPEASTGPKLRYQETAV